MAKRVRNAIAAVSALLAVTSLAPGSYAAALRPMTLAAWSGGSWSNDATGKFDHCALSANYLNGTTLFVSIGRDWNWQLAFANSAWHLQPGATIPAGVTFDRMKSFAGSGRVVLPNMAILDMANDAKLIDAFRLSHAMTVTSGTTTYPFALTATARVVPALAKCVKAELAFEQGGPAPDLQAAAADPPPAPLRLNPPETLSAAPSATPAAATPDDTLDRTLAATQIATNLLLQAKLPNARLLNASDTPDGIKGFGVAWASDAGDGAVKIMDVASGQTGQDVASQLISADASSCKGDFASGRSSELVDNSIVTKAFVACKQSSGMKSARYLIYQGGSTHYVVFDMLPISSSAAPALAAPEESTVQTAALKAVSYQVWK